MGWTGSPQKLVRGAVWNEFLNTATKLQALVAMHVSFVSSNLKDKALKLSVLCHPSKTEKFCDTFDTVSGRNQHHVLHGVACRGQKFCDQSKNVCPNAASCLFLPTSSEICCWVLKSLQARPPFGFVDITKRNSFTEHDFEQLTSSKLCRCLFL